MITLKMSKKDLKSAEVIKLFDNLTTENRYILYINQCNSNINAIEHVLEKTLNSKIFTVESYDDALTILKTFLFDIIIIDVNHPGAITVEFLRKLKAQSKHHIPVMLINNQNKEDKPQESTGNNFDALIVKPVNVDDFLQKVVGLLH